MDRIYENLYFFVTNHPDYAYYRIDFLDYVYPNSGPLTLILSLAVAAIFFNVINNVTANLGQPIYYYLFMILSGVIGFVIAFTSVINNIFIDIPVEGIGWAFALMNTFYAMLLYFLFSLICKAKKISLYANMLPFKTNW